MINSGTQKEWPLNSLQNLNSLIIPQRHSGHKMVMRRSGGGHVIHVGRRRMTVDGEIKIVKRFSSV